MGFPGTEIGSESSDCRLIFSKETEDHDSRGGKARLESAHTLEGLQKRLAVRQAADRNLALPKRGTANSPGTSTGVTAPRAPASLGSDVSLISRMLLVRLRSLGDSILTLPLLETLYNWRPDLHIDILVEAPFAAVFDRHPAVHEMLILRHRNQARPGGWSRLRACLEIRKRHYPFVINLHGGTTSLLFTLASGAARRVGYEHYRYSMAYNIRIPSTSLIWGRDGIHTVEHLLAPLRWLGIPMGVSPTGTLYLDEEAVERIGARLVRGGIRRGGFFAVHPTATLFTKQWPPSQFAQLADQLHRRYGLPVVFTSAPAEAQVLLMIGECARERHFYWSDLALDELFALIEGCRLFVGNDSGPAHAAAALHKPVVVVWGSSNFKAWHPWGTEYELVRSDLPCMPCPGYSCAVYGRPKCILEVPVEKVLQACEQILDRT
jgi:heptosyltransferase-3